MIEPSRILKQKARTLLMGKYIPSITIVMAAAGISLILAYLQAFSGFSPQGNHIQKLCYWAMNAVILLLESVFSIGVTYFFLQMSLYKPFKTSCLLYCFSHNPDRFIIAAALRYTLLALGWVPACVYYYQLPPFAEWSAGLLLPLVPLALLAVLLNLPVLLLYGQSFYILLEDGQCSVLTSMKKSRELMAGHKTQMFFLYLSFLGCGLLALGTLGLGVFWIRPYVEMTKLQFYLGITGRQTIENPVEASALTPPQNFL